MTQRLVTALCLLLFVAEAVHTQELKFGLEAEARYSAFQHDMVPKERTDLETRVMPTIWWDTNYRNTSRLLVRPVFRFGSPDYYSSLKFKNDYGDRARISCREFSHRMWWRDSGLDTGKSIRKGRIAFDFINLHPSASFDASEPFSVLEEENQVGVWGMTFWFNDGAVRLGGEINWESNFPVVAEHPDNRWTAPLPLGLSYGDPIREQELGFSATFSWKAGISGEIVFYRGSANFPDHAELRDTSIRLVFPEIQSATIALELSQFGGATRFGVAPTLQKGAEDFAPWIVEQDWIFESLLRRGDNLYLSLGVADVWVLKRNDISDPSLDVRRTYEGGTALGTVEYEPVEQLLIRATGLYNFDVTAFYVAPEFEFGPRHDFKISLRAELIGSKEPGNVFYANRLNDRLMVRMKYSY